MSTWWGSSIVPSLQFCRTSCFEPTGRSIYLQDCQVSRHVEGLILLFCAKTIQWASLFLGKMLEITKTIFVSSNSCWTLMMVSACLGSWYCSTYEVISGNDMKDGFWNEDWGTLAVKSSRSLVRREKAGRRGYSWSVTMTAEDDSGLRLIGIDRRDEINTAELFSAPSVIYVSHIVILLDGLALAGWCALCYRPGKEWHEFTHWTSLIERKRWKIGCIAENSGWARWRDENYGEGKDLHDRRTWWWLTDSDHHPNLGFANAWNNRCSVTTQQLLPSNTRPRLYSPTTIRLMPSSGWACFSTSPKPFFFSFIHTHIRSLWFTFALVLSAAVCRSDWGSSFSPFLACS